MPRIARSCARLSSVDPRGMNSCGLATAARASAFTVARRAAGMPIRLRSAAARRPADGNVRARRACCASGSGSPYSATSLLPNWRAASTVTCCPSTARTASSNASQQPGVRSPGREAIMGARAWSLHKCDVMASTSAPTSNCWRTRPTIDCRARTDGNWIVASRLCRTGRCETVTMPCNPSCVTTRRYVSPSTVSKPSIARMRRWFSKASQSYGGR